MSLLLLFAGAGATTAPRPRAVLPIAAPLGFTRRAEISANLAVIVRPVRLRVTVRPRSPLIVRWPTEPGNIE